MKPEAIISGVIGTAAAVSPFQDLPVRVFLLFTDFNKAPDPYACYQQFLGGTVQTGIWSACGSLNPMSMDPVNTWIINGIVLLIAAVLIGIALIDVLPKPAST
jgi:hypothetical protein